MAARRWTARTAATVVALVTALVGSVVALAPAPAGAAVEPPAGGLYYPVGPTRVFSSKTTDGPCIAGGESRPVPVVGGSDVPVDAASVVLNVTVTEATVGGFVTVFPQGEVRPTASSLNFRAGTTVANSVTVGLGASGTVAVFVNEGCAHVIVDVVGFHTDGNRSAGGFVPVSPVRRVDTRQPGQGPCVAGGTTRDVVVTGGAVPADAASVTLNLTAVTPTVGGFLTVFPAGTERPLASSINYAAGDVRANSVTVKVGAGGAVSVFADVGCVHVIVDVVGFTVAGTPAVGAYTAVAPTRLLNTRVPGGGGCVDPSNVRTLRVVNLPLPVPRIHSVTLNVTVVTPTSAGFLTVFPAGATRPSTSNINFVAGQVVANAVTVRTGALGQVSFFVNAGCAHLVVDLVGSTTLPPELAVVRPGSGYGGPRDGRGEVDRLSAPRGVVADPAGNVFFTDGDTVRRMTPTGVVSTVAGRMGTPGFADGPGGVARFSSPTGIARDAAGNLYVADTNNHSLRKVTPAGVVSTLVGNGIAGSSNGTPGPTGAARLDRPRGVVVTPSGDVLVADSGNSAIRRVPAVGDVTTFSGALNTPGDADGAAGAARFTAPEQLALDGSGNLVVADPDVGRVRRVAPDGTATTLGGCPPTLIDEIGFVANCTLVSPRGVAVLSGGDVAVADSSGELFRLTPSGTTGVFTRLAGAQRNDAFLDGTGAAARFSGPSSLSVLPGGDLVVADVFNRALRRVTPARVVTTVAGSGVVSGSNLGSVALLGAATRFKSPTGVAVVGNDVFIADSANFVVRRALGGRVPRAFAGGVGIDGTVNGTGSAARFGFLGQMVADAAGNLYVSEPVNCVVRKITPAAVVTVLAGRAGQCGLVDGTGTAARFNRPDGLALDAAGNLFVADTSNHAVRRVTPAGVVTTLAGNGTVGSANGSGAAARFSSPRGVAVDGSGNVYVADTGNHTVRKVTSGGTTSTLAGAAGVSGNVDATGGSARFNAPRGTVIGPDGQLYVADSLNRTVRRVTLASGISSTVAGTGVFPGNQVVFGSGGTAAFSQPEALAVDGDGDLWVVDNRAHSLVEVVMLP